MMAKTEMANSIARQDILTIIIVVVVMFLVYMDGHYWYSPFSYSHDGLWSDCRQSKNGDVTTFVCKQGEISIKEAK